MKKILACAAAAALVGCASDPIATSASVPVPESRIISADLMTQKPGTGTVIVKRDPAFYGSGCSYRLFANGAPFADVNRGEKVQIYLPSGEHILGAKANGLCGGGNPETSFTLGAGQTRIFRVGVEASGDVKLHPTAF